MGYCEQEHGRICRVLAPRDKVFAWHLNHLQICVTTPCLLAYRRFSKNNREHRRDRAENNPHRELLRIHQPHATCRVPDVQLWLVFRIYLAMLMRPKTKTKVSGSHLERIRANQGATRPPVATTKPATAGTVRMYRTRSIGGSRSTSAAKEGHF
jgi:hypothetical protein